MADPIVTPKQGRGYHDNHLAGADHYRWNDQKIISSHGYVKVRVGRDHPLADPNGYAYEHLLVWVAAGNPRPPAGFTLHHKNEVKADNRIENLELIDRVSHAKRHHNCLPDEDVRAIREAYATGAADMPALALRYGVPIQRVQRFVRGLVRLSAGGPITPSTRNLRGTRC